MIGYKGQVRGFQARCEFMAIDGPTTGETIELRKQLVWGSAFVGREGTVTGVGTIKMDPLLL